MGFFAVITSVQSPTTSVLALSEQVNRVKGSLLVIGDRKSPNEYDLKGCTFVSLEAQKSLPLAIARQLPVDRYSRKNVGYLLAILSGADCIYETDDDNRPLDNWTKRTREVSSMRALEGGWLNVYKLFTEDLVWPRGFPLDLVRKSLSNLPAIDSTPHIAIAPIQQGLANGSPDADAIWYLLEDKSIHFQENPSVQLPKGCWCPFNSQSTWWWAEAFPLMYLPTYCSFRMTDIWRSFVAQRCLWELAYGVVFHSAEVFQERNIHNHMKDFNDEISGYLRNTEMAQLLESLTLKTGVTNVPENLLTCYEALVKHDFFPKEELVLASAWVEDCHKAMNSCEAPISDIQNDSTPA